MKINQTSPLESEFTEVLSAIALKPKTLYYYGKMPENVPFVAFPGDKPRKRLKMRPKTVAIVGSRKNTAYGEEVAYRAAYELARLGIVIVSGLAIGIDSIAHRGALDAGGLTVAVLGTRITKIYPAEHEWLAEKIVEKGGAVMSEYEADDIGGQGETGGVRFLYRNRLIAGLADVVLVVEAAERSGSLNTASHALDQGKDVFAVPGGLGQIESEGCNNLIAAGAQVYRRPEDILTALFPAYTPRRKKPKLAGFMGSPAEKAILEQITSGVREGEEIMARAKVDVAEYNRAMTMLEIKGIVRSLGVNKWTLR